MKNAAASVSLRSLASQNPSKTACIQSQPLQWLGGQKGPSHSDPHDRIPDIAHSTQPQWRLPIISKGPLGNFGNLFLSTGPKGN